MTMRIAAATSAGVALLAVVAPAGASHAASAPAPSRLQVSASEFRLVLSRSTMRRGTAVVELVNYGQDDHDLALRPVGGRRVVRVGIVHPGQVADVDARLRPGRYVLWCTLADHRARGMSAALRVR